MNFWQPSHPGEEFVHSDKYGNVLSQIPVVGIPNKNYALLVNGFVYDYNRAKVAPGGIQARIVLNNFRRGI